MIGRSLGQDALGANKHVKVRPTLQLASHESIFALGDIILWDEQKQAFKAHGHASVIAANILSLLNGSKLRKEYKTGREMILVTNGKVCFDNPPPKQAHATYYAYRMVAACMLVCCGG